MRAENRKILCEGYFSENVHSKPSFGNPPIEHFFIKKWWFYPLRQIFGRLHRVVKLKKENSYYSLNIWSIWPERYHYKYFITHILSELIFSINMVVTRKSFFVFCFFLNSYIYIPQLPIVIYINHFKYIDARIPWKRSRFLRKKRDSLLLLLFFAMLLY